MADMDNKKEQIVRKAMKLFDQFGYENTSMRQIAAAVGSGKASLYYYFKSKEEIFFRVIEKEGAEYFDNFRISMKYKGDSLEKLKMFLQIPGLIFRKHSTLLIRMFFSEMQISSENVCRHIKYMKEMFLNIFKQLLELCQREGRIISDLEVERFIMIFFNNMHGIFLLEGQSENLPLNSEERLKNYNMMLRIMLKGIKSDRNEI